MKRLAAILCLTIAVLLGNAGAGYALPPCPRSPLEITGASDVSEWHNCEGQFTVATSVPKFAGEKYVGEFRDGKFHGQGTLTFADGNKYVDEYRYGKKNGQGTYTFANGRKYVGEFKNGFSHGKGIQYYADGTVEKEGIWKDDAAFQ